MKRKIVISSTDRTMIVAALQTFGMTGFAREFNQRFEDADPANDGPEVTFLTLLREKATQQ